MNDFTIIVHVPASRLLHCLAIDLQINPEHFLEKHSGILGNELNNESALRLLHYPPIDNVDPDNKITRCGKHTDYGGLTLLFQVPIYQKDHFGWSTQTYSLFAGLSWRFGSSDIGWQSMGQSTTY